MVRQHRKYTTEFKQESVNLALKSPSISRTANELGIPIGTLHAWINQLKGKAPTKATSGKPENSHDVAALVEENRRLHKELTIAREEKEILKKAAAYFAQNQK